jgi:uncharacterized lipoprotein YbaY
MKTFLGLAAVLAVAGCATKHPAPVTFRNAPEVVSTNSIADVPGWSAFKDPVENLMRTALTNNCDVRITLTKVDQNRAFVRQIEIHPVRNTQ